MDRRWFCSIRAIVLGAGIALLSSGCNLYAWGSNDVGQSGDGTRVNRDAPAPVLRNPGWLSMESGSHGTCAIDLDRSLWCWGYGAAGELGLGPSVRPYAQTAPARVGSATDWQQVSMGGFAGSLPELDAPLGAATCGIRGGGQLWCWGLPPVAGPSVPSSPVFSPTRVGTESDWTAIDVGAFHACGIRGGGQLWCWGRNDFGQIGDGTNIMRPTPVRIGSRTDWTAVSAGFSVHTCGIAGGSPYCWGHNETGQLGDGTTVDRNVPTPVLDTDGVTWTDIGTGGRGEYVWYDPWGPSSTYGAYTCALGADGTARCWGANDFGGLGDGSRTSRSTPAPVTASQAFTSLSVGGLFACGLTSEGQAWCWGSVPEGSRRDALPPGATLSPARLIHDGWMSLSVGGRFATGIRPPEHVA
ncbi:MAG: hypothetical protein KDB02_15815 [Acidimicrobiales bacterium]|nr:hypothetical protein [Acidimicrobiales bacterium]